MGIGVGEGDQNVGGSPKFWNARNLIRKGNRMRPKMNISRNFKSVEYSANLIDSESEEPYCIARKNLGDLHSVDPADH